MYIWVTFPLQFFQITRIFIFQCPTNMLQGFYDKNNDKPGRPIVYFGSLKTRMPGGSIPFSEYVNNTKRQNSWPLRYLNQGQEFWRSVQE